MCCQDWALNTLRTSAANSRGACRLQSVPSWVPNRSGILRPILDSKKHGFYWVKSCPARGWSESRGLQVSLHILCRQLWIELAQAWTGKRLQHELPCSDIVRVSAHQCPVSPHQILNPTSSIFPKLRPTRFAWQPFTCLPS